MPIDGPVVVRDETSGDEDDTSEEGEANEAPVREKSLEEIIDAYSD